MYSKELVKGTLKPVILQLLQEKGRMYGYEIAREIKIKSAEQMLVREGSLYPCLHSLAKDGLVETESEMVRGRTRKYYRLTQKGAAELPALIHEIEAFITSLKSMFQLKSTSYAI